MACPLPSDHLVLTPPLLLPWFRQGASFPLALFLRPHFQMDPSSSWALLGGPVANPATLEGVAATVLSQSPRRSPARPYETALGILFQPLTLTFVRGPWSGGYFLEPGLGWPASSGPTGLDEARAGRRRRRLGRGGRDLTGRRRARRTGPRGPRIGLPGLGPARAAGGRAAHSAAGPWRAAARRWPPFCSSMTLRASSSSAAGKWGS